MKSTIKNLENRLAKLENENRVISYAKLKMMLKKNLLS